MLPEPTFSFPISFLRNGVLNLAQAGTIVNGISSEVPTILPKSLEEAY
jgi:hypothetical protein